MGLLDQALDTVMRLPYEDKEILIDIVRKRLIEERREQIRQNADQAIKAFHAGSLKTETAAELISRLEASLEEEAKE